MTMKSISPLLLLLLMLTQCRKPAESTDFTLGKSWVAELNTAYHEDSGPLEVLPTRVIEDSRCPTYAICVWEGQVAVDVQIKVGAQELRDTLSTVRYLHGGDSVFFQGYKIKLLAVAPPRDRTDIPQEEYLLHLQVSR